MYDKLYCKYIILSQRRFLMPITADCHLHTSFSGDSDTPMEVMIQKGISLGLTHMCFTEHQDFEYPITEASPAGIFDVNTDAYLYDLLRYREKYKDKINILFGIELGLQPHLARKLAVYAKKYDFDFIIGSTHTCNGNIVNFIGVDNFKSIGKTQLNLVRYTIASDSSFSVFQWTFPQVCRDSTRNSAVKYE